MIQTVIWRPFVVAGRLWRRRRRTREWEHKRREFVYLDETSVTSLVAARHGAIPESFKDTLSSTTSTESGTSATAPSTPATPGVGISTRSSSSRTTSQEVVRRAVIQGTFRTLRIGDADLKLSVEDQPKRARPAAAHTARDLETHLSKLEKQHRAVRADGLLRGDVAEVQVELSPEWSFQIAAAVSSMIDLVEGRANLFGLEESTVREVQHMMELLSRLLVDLVPIQARVKSHRLVVVDGVEWVVDSSMIEGATELEREASEFHLAGVTELPLYWKDVRRVLFAGSAYSVYARLSRTGIQSSWSPVKLADVFDRFLPEVGEQIRELPRVFENAQSVSNQADALPVDEILRDHGLVPFGRDLARLASRDICDGLLLRTASDAIPSGLMPEDVKDIGLLRTAFEAVVDLVEASPSSLTESTEPLEPTHADKVDKTSDSTKLDRIDRHLVRTLREAHQTVAQLTVLRELAAVGDTEPLLSSTVTRLLEAEIVAIYW